MAFRGRLDLGWTLHASLILLILFWGLAFVAIKQALVFMSWITLTFLRFAIADVLFRLSGGHPSGAPSAGAGRPPDACHPRVLRIHRLSALPEPGEDGSERQCGHGGPDHRLGPGVHRDLRDSSPEGANREVAIRGDRPRVRGPRGDDLLRPPRKSIHVPRFPGRLDGRPARDFLRPLCGPRQELPPAVPSLHVRRVDPPHWNGPPGAPPDRDGK